MSDESPLPDDESPESDVPQPEASEAADDAAADDAAAEGEPADKPVEEEVFLDNWEGKMKQIVAAKVDSAEYEATAMACAEIADADVLKKRNSSGSKYSRPLWSQIMPRLVERIVKIQSSNNRGGDKTIENSLIACGKVADAVEAGAAEE